MLRVRQVPKDGLEQEESTDTKKAGGQVEQAVRRWLRERSGQRGHLPAANDGKDPVNLVGVLACPAELQRGIEMRFKSLT